MPTTFWVDRATKFSARGRRRMETSCLAIGLAGAALDFLRTEANLRPEVAQAVETLGPRSSPFGNGCTKRRPLRSTPEQALQIRSDALVCPQSYATGAIDREGHWIRLVSPAQRGRGRPFSFWSGRALDRFRMRCAKSHGDPEITG